MNSVRHINVRNDYRAFLAAKVMPGVRYEGDCAVAVGIELKGEYFTQAVANAERAVAEARGQARLFTTATPAAAGGAAA